MSSVYNHTCLPTPSCPAAARLLLIVAASLVLLGISGCAALTNPVQNGIPVHLLPPELLAEPKSGKVTIPLTFLKRRPPDVYRLGPGDVLSVFIDGVLPVDRNTPPPVNYPDMANLPPALGYPIAVQANGTVPLPLIRPLRVEGMTIEEAQRAIVAAYTTGASPILQQEGRARIIVTLIRPRQIRVLVVRQDSPAGTIAQVRRTEGVIRSSRFTVGGAEQIVGGPRRGTGTIVELPAYENDVLTALTLTGGLPGLDAQNEIVVQRGYYGAPEDWDPNSISATGAGPTVNGVPCPSPCPAGQSIRIPLRLCPGHCPPFKPEDVVLHEGDVVYIEARDTEVFYTGGLLPSGEFPLPRDYDLDAIEAIASVGGPLVNGAININNLNGAIIATGIGSPSPKLLTVLRRTPCGGQVPIMVDLNRALRDPRESLIIKSGDILILQEAREQAIVRYFTQVFNFSIFSNVIQTSRTTGTIATSVP